MLEEDMIVFAVVNEWSHILRCGVCSIPSHEGSTLTVYEDILLIDPKAKISTGDVLECLVSPNEDGWTVLSAEYLGSGTIETIEIGGAINCLDAPIPVPLDQPAVITWLDPKSTYVSKLELHCGTNRLEATTTSPYFPIEVFDELGIGDSFCPFLGYFSPEHPFATKSNGGTKCIYLTEGCYVTIVVGWDPKTKQVVTIEGDVQIYPEGTMYYHFIPAEM